MMEPEMDRAGAKMTQRIEAAREEGQARGWRGRARSRGGLGVGGGGQPLLLIGSTGHTTFLLTYLQTVLGRKSHS